MFIMARSTFTISILFLTSLLYMNAALKLNITPEKYTGDEDAKTVVLECHLDHAEKAAQEIMVMKIARKGAKPIAILHPGNRITLGAGTTKDKFNVSGRIEEEANKSHMLVTILQPTEEDSGDYTCVVNYVVDSGGMVEDKASSFLTVVDPKIKLMQENVEKLLAWMKKKDEEIAKLEKKSTPVAFSAANKNSLLYPREDVTLIFADVMLNLGQGYDARTGVFTAPQDGLYVFHLALEIACPNCRIRANIKANRKVLVNLMAGDEDQASQSSVTSPVALTKGDKVKAVPTFATMSSFLTNQQYSIFSGYMINP